MLNPTEFCNILTEILTHSNCIYIKYNSLFTNIDSMYFLHNNGLLTLDYCTYYSAKIKKKLAIINRMSNNCNKIIKLDNLCSKIYNHSLDKIGTYILLDNLPLYRSSNDPINAEDLYKTFNQIGDIKYLFRISWRKYIIKFNNNNDNLYLEKLIHNTLIEKRLITTKLINNDKVQTSIV